MRSADGGNRGRDTPSLRDLSACGWPRLAGAPSGVLREFGCDRGLQGYDHRPLYQIEKAGDGHRLAGVDIDLIMDARDDAVERDAVGQVEQQAGAEARRAEREGAKAGR